MISDYTQCKKCTTFVHNSKDFNKHFCLVNLFQSNWDFAKDNRTTEQVKKDFDQGLEMQERILKAIGYEYRLTNNTDSFGKLSKYKHDAEIKVNTSWFPVEVKWSRINLHGTLDLKKNQADQLIKGVYIQGTPRGYFIRNIKSVVDYGELVTDTYCNKPCYRIRVEEYEWRKYKNPEVIDF